MFHEVDLQSTLDGGQAFRWHRNGDHYRGVIGNKVYISENKNVDIKDFNKEIAELNKGGKEFSSPI